jgi:hypothetical protein
MTNKFTPAYVIARGLYGIHHRDEIVGGNRTTMPLWDEMSLYERNGWVATVDNVFQVMRELGYAVPDPKDKRK